MPKGGHSKASPITDALSLGALKTAFHYLPRAYENGNDMEAREKMMYASMMAGMAFNNAGLGYVHAMAHQLGGFYPQNAHGAYNATLLPFVLEYNSISIPDERIFKIAEAMDIPTNNKSKAINKIMGSLKELSSDIGITMGLKHLDVEKNDIDQLSQNALKDICSLTNPRQGTVEDIANIFKASM